MQYLVQYLGEYLELWKGPCSESLRASHSGQQRGPQKGTRSGTWTEPAKDSELASQTGRYFAPQTELGWVRLKERGREPDLERLWEPHLGSRKASYLALPKERQLVPNWDSDLVRLKETPRASHLALLMGKLRV